MVGCKCRVCLSEDPFNKRLRPSGLLSVEGKNLLIDTTPDLRQQALRYGISYLEGVLLTHAHYDHIGGLDELRTFYLLHQKELPVLASSATLKELQCRCSYLFQKKSEGVSLAAQLYFQVLEGKRGEVDFCGIPIRYVTYEQGGMEVNGFRVGAFAYVSDIKNYPQDIFDELKGIHTLVISTVGDIATSMHISLGEAMDFAKRAGASETWFTHISHRLEHHETNHSLPKGFALAYDGLLLEF